MTTKTCETCRWWGRERQHDMDSPYGSCRVKSPLAPSGSASWQVLPDADGKWDNPVYVPRAFWPWSAFDDWCGDYERAGHDD